MIATTRSTPSGASDSGGIGHIIVASNRGPVEFELRDDGALSSRRGSGGVVTALAAMAQGADLAWIACPMTKGDRMVARMGSPDPTSLLDTPGCATPRFVDVSQDAYDRYYNVFSNPLLW